MMNTAEFRAFWRAMVSNPAIAGIGLHFRGKPPLQPGHFHTLAKLHRERIIAYGVAQMCPAAANAVEDTITLDDMRGMLRDILEMKMRSSVLANNIKAGAVTAINVRTRIYCTPPLWRGYFGMFGLTTGTLMSKRPPL